MKKVTFLINSLTSGGSEKVLTVIMTELNKKNIEVELICLERNNFYTLPKGIKITYLSNLKGNENKIIKLFSILFFSYKLKKYIIEEQIELIQSHIYRAWSNFICTSGRIQY